MKVAQEIDVDNVTIIINGENKISCVPQEPAKVFTDEYNFLMDACGCGAYITRQTSEDQAVVVDYVKFTGKYTKKQEGYADFVVYRGISKDRDVLVSEGGDKVDIAYDIEGSPMVRIIGFAPFIKPVTPSVSTSIDREGEITYTTTYPALDELKDHTYEAVDCCATSGGGIEIEELPYGEFVDDNNVPNDYALRLVVGHQEVGIDKIGVIKGTQWLVFKASKFDLTQPVA